ncbi:GGDEF domain-containing protein [Amorphus sp. MBR-141]
MFDIFIPLLHNTGMLALAAVAYGFLLPRVHGMMANVALGLLFGLGASLSMLSPVELMPGILVDSRATIVILAGVFGGPVAALIAGGAAGACRLASGGLGMAGGLVSIGISIGIGVTVHHIARSGPGEVQFRHVLLAAAGSILVGLGLFLLPWSVASEVFVETALPVSLARIFGVLFLGGIMLDHHRRISAEERVRQLAYIDELSGLSNRRAFYAHLTREWRRWERYSENFVVVLLDIDRFKAVNDTYGHAAGDVVIQRVAKVMLEESRGSDMVARTGGEEFGLIMPYTSSASGFLVAERIRNRAQREVVIVENVPITFTVSLGVSADARCYRSMAKCLIGADQALYEAKNKGRNTVVIDRPPGAGAPTPRPSGQPSALAEGR